MSTTATDPFSAPPSPARTYQRPSQRGSHTGEHKPSEAGRRPADDGALPLPGADDTPENATGDAPATSSRPQEETRTEQTPQTGRAGQAGRAAQTDAAPAPRAETPTPAQAPAAEEKAAARTEQAPATPAPATTGQPPAKGATTSDGERPLVVLSGGKIAYIDSDVYVADLDTLTAQDADPDALFAALKDLRAVRGSDARTRVADKVHTAMRERMGL